MNIPTAQRNCLEAEAMQLLLECPRCADNPAFCPLYGVRKLDLWERIKWVSGLPTGDLEYLSTYHRVCSRWLSTPVSDG